MKTSLCNEHPLTPHFYIVKLGFTGVYFFLIFAPKQRLWVLIRTASLRRFSRVPTINVLSKNEKNIKKNHLKMNIFTAVKYCYILRGCVFIMAHISDKISRCLAVNSLHIVHWVTHVDWSKLKNDDRKTQ